MKVENWRHHLAAEYVRVTSAPKTASDLKTLDIGQKISLTPVERLKTASGAIRSVLLRLRSEGFCTKKMKLELGYDMLPVSVYETRSLN